MSEYIEEMESIFNRLESMDSTVPSLLQVAVLLPSFGNKERSPFGSVVSALQTLKDDDLTRDSATCRLLQEYESMQSFENDKKENYFLDKTLIGRKEIIRFGCGKKGHIKRSCLHSKGKPHNRYKNNQNSSHQRKYHKYEESHEENAMTVRSINTDFVDSFIVDSGASQHMVHRRSILENVNNSVKRTVITGYGIKLYSARCGSVFISSNRKEPQKGIALTNLLYFPKLDSNLISCDALSREGYSTIFRNGTIRKDCKIMHNIKVQNGLYTIPLYSIKADHVHTVQTSVPSNDPQSLWR